MNSRISSGRSARKGLSAYGIWNMEYRVRSIDIDWESGDVMEQYVIKRFAKYSEDLRTFCNGFAATSIRSSLESVGEIYLNNSTTLTSRFFHQCWVGIWGSI